MADYVLKNVKVYYEGYDLSGDHNAASMPLETETLDDTCFGDSSHSFKPGLKTFNLAHSGFMNCAGNNYQDDVLFDNMATADKIITVCPTTGAEGQIGYSTKGVSLSYEWGGTVGEMATFAGAARSSSSDVIRGTILATGAKTSTGTGTARQLGHSSYDSEQGNLSYTTENSSKTFTDDGQDFTDWDTPQGLANYMIMITNSDSSKTYGYLGATVSATEIYVYQEQNKTTSGWNGTDPDGKTPSSYEIWKAGRYIYAAMHITAVSGTSPTLDMIIRSDDNADMSSPTTKITFAQKSAIGATWGTRITADIPDTYFQASYTIGGSDPSFTVAVNVAIQ